MTTDKTDQTFRSFEERYREAVHEYELHYNSPIITAFGTFRHHDKRDQDRILNQFREKYPKLYVLLLEVQSIEEQHAKFDAEKRMRKLWEIPEASYP